MFVRKLLGSILDLPGAFADVLSHDPVAAVLLVVGGIVMLFSLGFFGLLVLGALADLFTPSPGGRPGQPGR